jgi:RNA polymerase sigma-70 factor, ECF subfamily
MMDDGSAVDSAASLATRGAVGAPLPAFAALLESALDGAFGVALRYTRNRSDAEDLVQEAALLACRGFHSFTPGSNFKGWFYRILTNCFYSNYRRERTRGVEVELEDAPELYLYEETAALGLHHRTDDPANLLIEKLTGEQVETAIGTLPDEHRVVATLYFLEDFSYQEIADVVGVPVGTVRSRLHRSRRVLQKALWTIAKERGIVSELSANSSEED